MILYWVRHGETVANVSGIIQGPNDLLNEQGRIQADKIAERVATLSVDAVYSSPFPRAHETAKAIATRIGKDITVFDELHESMWAEKYWGLAKDDPIILELLKLEPINDEELWNIDSHEPWKRLVERADIARTFFEKQEGAVLAVSHGYFSKFFALRMLLGDALTLPAWNKAEPILRISNTALSVFEFSDGAWRMITWNDHAHLG
jgi:uncharacterized phosphatase